MKFSRSKSTTGTGASGDNAPDAAPDEMVEHDIAYNQNAAFGGAGQDSADAGGREVWLVHFVSNRSASLYLSGSAKQARVQRGGP